MAFSMDPKTWRANSWFTTATRGAFLSSCHVNARPASGVVPAASKYPGETAYSTVRAAAFDALRSVALSAETAPRGECGSARAPIANSLRRPRAWTRGIGGRALGLEYRLYIASLSAFGRNVRRPLPTSLGRHLRIGAKPPISLGNRFGILSLFTPRWAHSSIGARNSTGIASRDSRARIFR